jgi:Transmembrane domain of unknown function (DUF3566)
VDHRAEPASWLPEGTTPDDSTSETEVTEQLPGAAKDGPYVPRQEGSYTYLQGGSVGYSQQGAYGEEATSGSRHQPLSGAQPAEDKLAYQASLPPDPSPTGAPVGGASAVGHVSPAAARAPFSSYRPTAKARPTVPARRANLIIARLEPWSVMKFSFLMSLVAWVVLFVAVALLYYALAGLGVFDAIERAFRGVTSSQGSGGVNLNDWLSASRVLGYTMLIGAMNVILITALSTVGAVIYNLVSYLGRGIEITLKEPD